MIALRLIFISILFTACKAEETGSDENYQCDVIPLVNDIDRIELIQQYDEEIVQGLASASAPNAEGAMGRNKEAYFHVRFQIGIAAVADYAVFSENPEILELTFKAMEYSFDYQLEEGDFELKIPENLEGSTLNPQDLASGTAFFLSSLGLALNILDQSNWYNSSDLIAYHQRLELLQPKIQLAADWLLTQESLLEMADQNAPNRLFYDALAFYSLGKWLEDENLKEVGLEFAQLAINKKEPEGYFLEGDGWDSSYQGVANQVGFNLFSVLDAGEPLKQNFWDCLSCSTDWQKSRIMENGEISTENNTRVYPGGESFLGQEKFVDWKQTMGSFLMMHYYSENEEYYELAITVKDFYE